MDGRISECRWPDLPAPYDAALREATVDVLLRGIRGRNRFPSARGNEKWQEHSNALLPRSSSRDYGFFAVGGRMPLSRR